MAQPELLECICAYLKPERTLANNFMSFFLLLWSVVKPRTQQKEKTNQERSKGQVFGVYVSKDSGHGLKEPRLWSRKVPISLSGWLTTARRKTEQTGKRRQDEDSNHFQETDQQYFVGFSSFVFWHLSLNNIIYIYVMICVTSVYKTVYVFGLFPYT